MGEDSGSSWAYRIPVFTLLAFVIALKCAPVTSLRDDWYGFVSFEDTSEWQTTYSYTCGYDLDLFREPRQFSHRDHLKGRKELQTPVRFSSKKTVKANESVTLHIYNNPGIRKAHSVSYGFQRNKECLHGQDADCIVFAETGRVRAVVLNADRFTEKLNLNYVKDHFLIEKPERFVTILNGGSIFERKFYEAVFLGGYTKDPTRSSHQIDNVKYPLEIYMYFFDETVPSVSLSTILVVLVEESDRDNPHIKPIVNTVEQKLYDEERRFLERNKLMIRRERLYHHLEYSTHYDVYDSQGRALKKRTIFQESLDSSVLHESTFTRYVEPFEKMQALEAEMFFILEDHRRVEQVHEVYFQGLKRVVSRLGTEFFPANFAEYNIMALTAIEFGFIYGYFRSGIKDCKAESNEFIRNGGYLKAYSHNAPYFGPHIPKGAHLEAFIDLTVEVCEYLQRFNQLYQKTYKNETSVLQITPQDKYQYILEYQKDRSARDDLNKKIFDHFHNNPAFHDAGAGDPEAEYRDDQQKEHIMDGILDLVLSYVKRKNYQLVQTETRVLIENIWTKLEYEDEESMFDVIRYLKFGSKQNDLKYTRAAIHRDFVTRHLPLQEKRRTLAELGGLEMTDEEIKEYESRDPIKITINEAFQVSWLMPSDGGYYFYQGGSPIPPCFRSENVIVFKKPISMSRRQIEILTRIPTSFDKTEDIHFTTPHVHDTKFEVELTGTETRKSRLEEVKVKIYDQKRNHLFLGHDGVHRNAVEVWDQIKQKKSNATSVQKKDTLAMVMSSLMILFLLYVM